MRKLCTFICVFLALCVYATFPQRNERPDDRCQCTVISKSIKEIAKFNVGMTRGDLSQVFDMDGGLSTRKSNRYIYKKCAYIKVDVEFEPLGDSSNVESPNDKIIKISKPYLEYPFAD